PLPPTPPEARPPQHRRHQPPGQGASLRPPSAWHSRQSPFYPRRTPPPSRTRPPDRHGRRKQLPRPADLPTFRGTPRPQRNRARPQFHAQQGRSPPQNLGRAPPPLRR